jgi:hypothetical protein
VIPVSVIDGSKLAEVPKVRLESPSGVVDVTTKDKRKKQNVKMRLKLCGLLNIYRAAGQYSVNITGLSAANILKHSDGENTSVPYKPFVCVTIRL